MLHYRLAPNRAIVNRGKHDPHPASPDPRDPARREGGQGIDSSTAMAAPISTRRAARRCPASATAIPTSWRRSSAARPARLRAYLLLHHRAGRTLADTLIAGAPAGIEHVYFVSGGSEAIEAALKMARQYFVETGRAASAAISSPAARAITAIRSARSRPAATSGGAALRAAAARDPPYRACYAFRDQRPTRRAEPMACASPTSSSGDPASSAPETVAAFIAEPVVGATLGACPPVPGYFKRIREICDRYGVLLILDEVMCGMGRTGTLYACEQEGIAPDLITIAKGLGAGYQPIGAVLRHRARSSRRSPKARASSSTATPTWAIRSPAPRRWPCSEVIERDQLLDNVRGEGAHLPRRLTSASASIRMSATSAAAGCSGARARRRPRDQGAVRSELKLNARVKREAMERGLMCYPMGGTVDGERGRSRAAGAALHRRRGGDRRDRRTLGDAVDAASPKHKINPAYMRPAPSTRLRSA